MASGTKERILAAIEKAGSTTGSAVAEHLGISRQAVHKHLKALVLEGKVAKRGVTRSAVYELAGAVRAEDVGASRSYRLQGLAEDRAFQDLATELGLDRLLTRQAFTLFRYSFTEILNNAIEHSHSATSRIEVAVGPYEGSFQIRDFGVGIFRSIVMKLGMADETAALRQLLKGKTTTMRERHSGEGIFFVSRAADRLEIRSHRTSLTIDNRVHDTFVGQERFLRGTEVRFQVARRSRKDLASIFSEYAPPEFDLRFERTRVLVRLHLEEYVSRSEAKRLLSGLEKFKEIILDFDRVLRIGQGFADEVFRVFPSQHPGVAIKTENTPRAVDAMIRHVVDDAGI